MSRVNDNGCKALGVIHKCHHFEGHTLCTSGRGGSEGTKFSVYSYKMQK